MESPKIYEGDEKTILAAFWSQVQATSALEYPIVGFNSNAFDLPVIIRRSWANGIPVPFWVRKGRYFADCFVDLMDVWACGNREQRISLSNLSRFLGCGETVGSGADFHKMTHEEQIAHLTADLQITRKIAEKLLN